MSAETITRESCLADARAEAALSEACLDLLGDRLPWLTAREEGTLILFGVLALVIAGYFVQQSRQNARARLKRIRETQD